ncbi:hypothetical protein YC2023_065777 [Brassica napus]
MKQGWINCLMISSNGSCVPNRRTYYSYYNWSRPNNLVKRLFGLQICGLGSGISENKGGLCLIQNPRKKRRCLRNMEGYGLPLDFFDDGGGVDWDEIVEYTWIIVIMGLFMVQDQFGVSLYLTAHIMGANP